MATITDIFAGAGGSSTGAASVSGVEVKIAANHWRRGRHVGFRKIPASEHAIIRARADAGELQRVIAADYGVSRPTVSRIVNG